MWFNLHFRLVIQALTIGAPGMVGGRARRFAEFVVERLAGHEFGLALLSLEDRMLEQPTLVADGNLAVGLLVDRDAGVAQGITRTRGLDLVDDLVVLQGEVLGECACILAGEDHVQVVGGPERAMGVARVGGDDGEALIEIVHELGDEGVAGFKTGKCPANAFP